MDALQKLKLDPLLTVAFVLLMGIGMLMVFSASSIQSLQLTNNQSMYMFMKKQLMNDVIGIVGLIAVAKFPYKRLRNHITSLNLVTIVLLLMIIPFGIRVNGAKRWLSFGFQFQPSELAKIVVIITLANILANYRRWGTLNKFKSLALIGTFLGFYAALIGIPENHASVVMVIFLVAGTMMLFAGLNRKIILLALSMGIGGGALVVLTSSFRRARVLNFMDPLKDALGKGYQITQNWYALGSGQFWGLGLGMSREKFGWLPEPHTDFILSVIGEELGYKGVLFIMGLFLLFVARTAFIALKTKDDFGVLLVSGIGLLIFYQMAINMAVISGTFPVTGMPLPFISYGGTDTIMLCMGVGLIYSVYSTNQQEISHSEEDENNGEVGS